MGELQRASVQRKPAVAVPQATARARRPEHDGRALPLQRMMRARALQPALAIGPANDPFEREAERTADSVVSMQERPVRALGGGPIAASLMRVQRALGKGEAPTKKDDDDKKRVQKSPAAATSNHDLVPHGIEAGIGRMSAGGEPLSPSMRAFFEPRFGYDFSNVRTHTGSDAAGAAVALGARAFTVGNHIFFGSGEYRADSAAGQRLIAHELTHTIQQQPEAARSARLLAAPERVQRGLWDVLSDPKAAALAKVREWANELPPYELLTVLLGRDPINDKQVERSPRNWIHAALKLVPNGMAIFADLEKNKTIEKAAQWFDAEVAKLNLTWEGIKGLFRQAWDALSVTDFLDPLGAWGKVKAVFGPTLRRIAYFAAAVGGKILDFIKKAVLGKLAAWAKEQPGYTLLTFVLGKDPVTGEAVERTARNFVKAVLDLVPGGDKIFENLEKTKAIETTVAWLHAEITKLDLSWEKIKDLFRRAWDAFTVSDLLAPLTLIGKIAAIFVPPAKRVIAFAIAVGKKVLEFIFEGAMMIAGPIGMRIVGIVRKIGGTFQKIVEDPIGFVGNLVQAIKLGFQQFGKNIWEHLKTGVIDWLVGALEGAGLVLPKVWDLQGVLDLTLQILGITYAKMRVKIVKVLGEERVAKLEGMFKFLMAIVTGGPAAAWQMIVDAIGSVWDMVIGGIKDWAVSKIVGSALTKLAMMLNPAGAIIQAIIAIYNTVAFFIERIKQIVALVEAIVDSIANIAAGKLAAAAGYVESAMARTIPVILGFLARLINLGDVSGAIKKVILAIQAKVDKAIDAVIAWIVEKAKALFGKGDEGKTSPGAAAVSDIAIEGEEPHTLSIKEEGGQLIPVIHSAESQIGTFLDAIEANDKFSKKRKQKYLPQARADLATVNTQLKALKKAPDEASDKTIRSDLLTAEKALAASIKLLLAGANMAKLKEKYLLEGVVKTYATMPKPTYDKLTPDHQPQAALITLVAGLKGEQQKLFAGMGVVNIAASRAAGGVAINLHEKRHYEGRTYGKPVSQEVENRIMTIEQGNDKEPKKRKLIMGIVAEELKADIEKMKNVWSNPEGTVWNDIDDVLKGGDDDTKDDAKSLKKEIADRIKSGESEVAAQDLGRWSS